MSFPAQVFRILIASPSDVAEERELAVRAIQEWNDLNAAERQIVLLPLRWESHAAPEYGKRPQEIINRQVVDHCDLLVGAFWTRVGSPTGVADSGTIEEIERVASGGKPVMLYFSQAKQDPEKIDLEQLAKLRDFKKKTFPNALIENYAGPVEFKEKLSKQLEIQLRTLLANKTEGTDDETRRPITDVTLHFADAESGADLGERLEIKAVSVEIDDFSDIPDYLPPPATDMSKQEGAKRRGLSFMQLQSADPNHNYYRQLAAGIVVKSFFKPVRFWLKNQGSIGARDVYIDLRLTSSTAPFTLISKSRLPQSTPTKSKSTFLLGSSQLPSSPDELIKDSTEWSANIEVRALQPQRELSPEVEFLIGARETCDVTVSATIFADTLSEPATQTLTIHFDVEQVSFTASEIIESLEKSEDAGKL